MRWGADAGLTALLLVVAGLAWWATVRLSMDMSPDMDDGMDGMDGMGFALGPFLVAWAAMMAAMMLPAVTPVVRLYARAARAGRVAPAGFFVSGYLVVWVGTGLPAAVLWSAIQAPLMEEAPWALRLAGATLVAAGLYQLSPLKKACLRHCRSPMGYFMRSGRQLHRPLAAVRAGATHGIYCLGCCVGLMLVLVAAVAMQPLWALVIAAMVFVERNLPHGEAFSYVVSALLVLLGGAALIEPAFAAALTEGVSL